VTLANKPVGVLSFNERFSGSSGGGGRAFTGSSIVYMRHPRSGNDLLLVEIRASRARRLRVLAASRDYARPNLHLAIYVSRGLTPKRRASLAGAVASVIARGRVSLTAFLILVEFHGP